MASSASLKEYLKRYESKNEDEEQKRKKKKRKEKKSTKPAPSGVLVVDEDPDWKKPVNLEEEEEEDNSPDDRPVVDEDIEVKRMRRLEQIRLKRASNGISEDGSGWVSLSPKRASSVHQNSDISPPRRQRTRQDTPSPEPVLSASDSGSGDDGDLSPPRKVQSSRLDSDLSHPRRGIGRNDSDISPPHRRMRRNDADLFPPRRRTGRDAAMPGADLKAEREDDLSPPRKRKVERDGSSPVRRDTDLSPVRRRGRHASSVEPDISPPRRYRKSEDLPPRRKSHRVSARDGSPDISPPRASRVTAVSDLSPPRKDRKESSVRPPLKERPKTGLISGAEVGEEIYRTKEKEWLRFKEMDPEISGRGAQPVYRDKKTGKRISKEDHQKSLGKVEEKPKENHIEWGKGLAQKREAEARLQELELEKDKPFARTRDDPELDNMLKERVRWGDPMAHLVKKKYSEPAVKDLGDAEKMKESGFIIPQDVPSHSWLKRGLDAAPNRYGIRPGRHWDGVDRSNGFEKKMFKRVNEKQATEREAYLWSVSDM